MANLRKMSAGIGLALVASALVDCKPKGAGSNLKSIVDFDASGNARTALELLPLRNFSTAPLAAGSNDGGVKQADAIVRTRLFALVECTAVVGSKGDHIDAATLMSAVEARAAIDDLYLDEFRNLLTSKDDNKLAEYGNAQNKLVKIPCRIYGRRLLSWDVLTDIQVRAAGIPKKPNAADAGIMSVYRLAQVLHLSLRGNYNQSQPDEFMPRVPAMMDMIYEQAGMTPSAPALTMRMKQADAAYNVCSHAQGPASMPDVSALKTANWTCRPHPTKPGVSVYSPGGTEGYNAVRDQLAVAIEGTHGVVFAKSDQNDDQLAMLWDMVTSTAPFPANDKSNQGRLGMYLATGKGLNFAGTFGSGVGGAVHTKPTALKRYNSNDVMAPLALGLPEDMGKTRMQTIVRANGPGDANRALLEGGQRSLTPKRAGTAAGRISQLGKYMGGGGAAGLAGLSSEVSAALVIVRKPAS